MEQILNYTFFIGTDYEFTVLNLLVAILILIGARIFLWFFGRFILKRYYIRRNVDVGSRFAFNQIIKYFIYLLAFLLALQSLGLQLTVILGGLAALAVGIGLGLQQTFNDLTSGIILLFDRSIEVGDVIKVGDEVGQVERIGMRTSEVRGRNNAIIIVPNSKMVVENVVNWSSNDDVVKFVISLGVAYGTDTEQVRDVLIQVAKAHKKVLDHPAPFVQFKNFGSSSLDFELHFWSKEFMLVETVMSDLRFQIDKEFREEGIVIPFPQTDVWLKKD